MSDSLKSEHTDDTDENYAVMQWSGRRRPRQWVQCAVTPVVTVVSVVNGVSSMSDDAPPALAEIDFAPHAWPRPGGARAPPRPSTTRTHPLYTKTTDPALRRYLQFNNKQPKTYKALSIYKHELSHAHDCYIDDCDIHNGYKVLVNTS